MNMRPQYNALAAASYIGALVLFVDLISGSIQEETILVPVFMLSLFVLSVATMGLLFFYKPAILLLEGNSKEAIGFLLKTLFTFAAIVMLIALALVGIEMYY